MGRRGVALLLVGACLLGGCTGDPEPKIDDPTPTPTSASPTVSATTEAADPQQEYRDFIDAYVAAISTSLSTGDPQPWLDLSDPLCENCPIFAQNVRDAYSAGGHIEGAQWTLKKARLKETNSLGQIWYLEVHNARERWLDGNGDEVKVIDESINYLAFAIEAANDRLSLRELRFRQP